MADLTDQQVRDEWLKYYGPNEGADTAKRSVYDYIPAIYGSAPSYFEGLLGAPETKALQGRATLAGLLGTAGSLAQGMSSVGPRRSAAQNILSALGAGFGTAGQTYQQGLQNFATQQQLQANIDKQKAFAQLAQKYPELAPLARLDPGKFVEMAMQLEMQKPIAEAYKQAAPQPAAPAQPSAEEIQYQQDLAQHQQDVSQYKDQFNKMFGIGDNINMTLGAEPVQQITAGLYPGTVEMNPVPEAFTGKYSANLPEAPVAPTAPVIKPQVQQAPSPEQILRSQKETLLRANANLSRLGTKAANDEVKNNLEQIKTLDTQIQQYAIGGFDFDAFKNSIPENLHANVDSLKQLAKSGSITGDQLRQGLQSIQTAASQDLTSDIKEYKAAQNDPKSPFKGSFIDYLKTVKPLGATQVNVAANTFAKEFGKGVSEAIQTTYAGANAAQGTIATIENIRPLVQKGVYAGPLSGAPRMIDQLASSMGVAGANTEEKLSRTAEAMQGLANLELSAASAMKGQGQITENERALIQRAAGGNFREFTQKEVITLLNGLEKVSKGKIAAHEKNLSALRKREDTKDLAEFYDLGKQGPTKPKIRTYNPATGRIE